MRFQVWLMPRFRGNPVNKFLLTLGFAIFGITGPVQAASGPFFSLSNTDFVVSISFIIFVGAIIYFKAPKFVAKLIDGQIARIEGQLKEASSVKEDAQQLLESLQKKQKDAEQQATRIKEQAQKDKELAIAEARNAIQGLVDRKIQNSREQVRASEAKAIANIRNQAIDLAIDAASEVIFRSMGGDDRRTIIDQSIKDINKYLN